MGDDALRNASTVERLWSACRSGDVDSLQAILAGIGNAAAKAEVLEAPDELGLTCIHICCYYCAKYRGHVGSVKAVRG